MTREEAIERIKSYKRYLMGGNPIWSVEEVAKAFDMAIEALSAERTGEWLDRSDGGRIKYPWWESCECSKCGEYGSGAYNFCPNCGANMLTKESPENLSLKADGEDVSKGGETNGDTD